MRILRAWLAGAGVTSGPIFRSVAKGSRVAEGLSTAAVATLFKAMATAAGVMADEASRIQATLAASAPRRTWRGMVWSCRLSCRRVAGKRPPWWHATQAALMREDRGRQSWLSCKIASNQTHIWQRSFDRVLHRAWPGHSDYNTGLLFAAFCAARRRRRSFGRSQRSYTLII